MASLFPGLLGAGSGDNTITRVMSGGADLVGSVWVDPMTGQAYTVVAYDPATHVATLQPIVF